MGSEYGVRPTELIVEDPNFPGVQGFGKTFTFPDQFPVMKEPYAAKGKVHTIIRLDWSKLSDADKRPPARRRHPGRLRPALRQGPRLQLGLRTPR